MKALITGASSGIGKELAIILSEMGYDLILVARRKKKLEQLQNSLKTNCEIIVMDISSTFNCMDLYNQVKKQKIDVLINNAGFGIFGNYENIKLDDELDMIDLNIKSLHTLTKLFYKDFKKRDSGYILNIASSAAFLPGPLMASYYATKSYVLKLTESLNEELRHDGSSVYIGALCPGPVDTEFNKVAKVNFNIKSLDASYVAKYAIKQMFKEKVIIIPGIKTKMGIFALRFLPNNLKRRIGYSIQSKKEN